MDPLCTQSDLEDLIGVGNVGKLFNDTAGDTPNAQLLAKSIGIASDRARGLLFAGFPDPDEVTALAADNDELRAMVAMLAVGVRMLARPTFAVGPDGQSPYAGFMKAAEKDLEGVGSGKRRLGSEATVGPNALIGAKVTPPKAPVFRATKCDRLGPGGF